MKLFVIGGSGYVGTEVCTRLLADGHELTGLARTERSVQHFRSMGITPVRGSMDDAGVIAEQSELADGVVQMWLGGALTNALTTGESTVRTSQVILDTLRGSNKLYLWTSGVGVWLDTGLLDPDREVTEKDPISPPYFYEHLGRIMKMMLGEQEVRTAIIAPGQVYGHRGGCAGPTVRLFDSFREHGAIYGIEGTGNAISHVHVEDLADLYSLVVSEPKARGVYFGVSDTVPHMDLAVGISNAVGLDGNVEIVNPGSIRELNGRFAELDWIWNLRASSERARKELGWRPSRPGILEEMANLPQPLDLTKVYPSRRRAPLIV
ncbi:NAD-dependent epimerase/dehydratase family protein [Paramicrobacterium fandaimingii]|uniref:NAD-dependent epimerase/dehydratase family protein n=1 Tax=Paramicrobacterium fandaimingii TaxID=2708079 RepID=UPI00141E0C95|nr:NAD-dependent epimerase/dehydratase family protein [Microbacterium fandaimingii]